MKKLLITVTALIIVVAIAGVIFVNLNKEKPSITASSFYTTMSQKGYSVEDATNQVEGDNVVKQIYVAVSEDYSYQIEFWEFLDDSYATSFYNENKAIFESSKGNVSAETSVGFKNYSKYTLSSNGKYMVVSRIDNTAIYVDVDDNCKDTVKAILNELGY